MLSKELLLKAVTSCDEHRSHHILWWNLYLEN